MRFRSVVLGVWFGLLCCQSVDAKDPSAGAGAVLTGPAVMLQEHGAGEGPVWHPQLGLLSSGEGNINRRGLDGRSSVYRAGAGSNGLLFDRQGRLVVCESKARRVTRTELDGGQKVLAAEFDGMKFNTPNDLAIDSQNRVYFSDPRYGDRASMEMVDADGVAVEGVYRIDLDGAVARVITHEVDRPNGLIVTPDDKFLYVADNNNAAGGARKLWRFDLKPDGNVALNSRKLIHDWKTSRGPDGMKLDTAGRLYVAAGLNQPHLPQETANPADAGIYVFAASGDLIQFTPIPRDETTNCAFGGSDGKTLFVTAGGTLWAIQATTTGYQIK